MQPTEITIDEMKPKFQDKTDRYNNWYFTADFTSKDTDYCLKIAITEGSLMGQKNYMSLSWEPLKIIAESDAQVLKKSARDINLVFTEESINFTEEKNQLIVEMGDIKAYCKPEERRIVVNNKKLSLDLILKPRGPIFYWGKQKGALCEVTEETRVAGIESLSTVKGTIRADGRDIKVDGHGLFERVWFGQLNFFQIRVMNWIYANFDQLYTYVCHTESVTSESQPMHFETGKIYLIDENEYLFADAFEVTPESWVYFEEARRFIPFEQSVEIHTNKGKLKYNVKPYRYPQLIQPPTRLESLNVDNIPGWNSLFYDLPVKLEGQFIFKDGEKLSLTNGRGINELIRIVPL